MTKLKGFASGLFLLIIYQWSYGQKTQDGFENVSLNDLSAFVQPAKIWNIGADAQADFNQPSVMALAKGTGIVAGTGNASLVTINTFADLELEFDFMLAKNARAGFLMQGRYELNLGDSWAKQAVNFSDCGGIAERWDESRSVGNRGFEGVAPSMNVCRAPGLWQHVKMVFRAPQFNDNGEKKSNARFEEVYLNGTLIHQQVQLSGPSKNALYRDEKQLGPLVFTDDSGSVAFRKINYRKIGPLNVQLNGLKYRYYKAEFKGNQFPDLSKLSVSSQDTLSQLSLNIGKGDEVYALDIDGNLELPRQDTYTFSLFTNGMGRLFIDDQLLVDRVTNRWNNRVYSTQASLMPGKHKIRVVYVKNISEQKPALVVSIKGVNTDKIDLNDKGSAPVINISDPVFLQPQGTPYLLRSFLNFGTKKLTHTISVGDPNQLNYSYDLKQGALIQVWRGEFLDVTNMWLDRGEPQIAIPRGSLITFSDAPAVAVLTDSNSAWPDSLAFDDLKNKGYTLDDKRAPTFRYSIKGVTVSDKISTGEEKASIMRQITVTNSPANYYCRVASAEKIELVNEGIYRIDDKSYYIRLDKKFKPILRQTSKGAELIVPFQSNVNSINYYITW